MAPHKDEILKLIHENLEIIKGFGVRNIGLFGSIIRGQNDSSSDIDILVEFEAKTFDAYMDTKEFLEDLFGHTVDLVIKDALKPRLRDPILKEVVYAEGF